MTHEQIKRPLTETERRDILEICSWFASEHYLEVAHNFSEPDSVWLTVSSNGKSVASGFSTAEVDAAPSFIDVRFATVLTLNRMWPK